MPNRGTLSTSPFITISIFGFIVAAAVAAEPGTLLTGKADSTETFAEAGLNKPFGVAFYPPGDDPQFLYVANTDRVIRFPYRNGDLKVRGPAQKLAASLSPGAAFLRSGGHWTRDIVFSPDAKKMYVSIGSRSNISDSASEAE